jgi:hypothetical protein
MAVRKGEESKSKRQLRWRKQVSKSKARCNYLAFAICSFAKLNYAVLRVSCWRCIFLLMKEFLQKTPYAPKSEKHEK